MNKFLIDTNILVYFLQPKPEYKSIIRFMEKIYDDDASDILFSVIVEAEVYSVPLPPDVKRNIELLFFEARMVRIDSDISRKAGEVRVNARNLGYRIKLPDALIAATALLENAHLVTHNLSDFQKISQFEPLRIIDPLA